MKLSFLHTGTPIVDFSFDGLGIFSNIESPKFVASIDNIKYLGPDEFYIENITDNDVFYISMLDNNTISGSEALLIYQDSLLSLNASLNQGSSSVNAMFALGRVNNTSGDKYVIVIDGWNDFGRWVRNNYYGDVSGYKVFVTN